MDDDDNVTFDDFGGDDDDIDEVSNALLNGLVISKSICLCGLLPFLSAYYLPFYWWVVRVT